VADQLWFMTRIREEVLTDSTQTRVATVATETTQLVPSQFRNFSTESIEN